MKRSITIFTLALVSCMATAQNSNGILQKSKGSITFVVDEDLKPIEDDYPMEESLKSGAFALYGILRDEGVPGDTHAIIARSFSDDEYFYTFTGKDVFFKTVVRAYAEHRPLVLSPDMIWVLISQGFARYVDAHAEEMRDMIVSHDGKMDLAVQTDKDLLTEETDWEQILSDFTARIHENTKGDIAKTITADFSTTGVTERITSQITLMETMKNYFDFIVVYLACGIPNITLKGTPDDWQKVLDKTQQLEQYDMTEWINSLKPILREFVRASNGKPNQKFWKNMVKKNDPNKLIGGGCDFREPTQLDGWILKFFPDENGLTLDQVPHNHKMPSERVYVDFIYQIISPADGTVLSETPLQLVAGFIGTEVDRQTHTLTPKMGWVVRQMKGKEDIVKRLEQMDSESSFMGIELRVKEVPEHLSLLPHIRRLTLLFTSDVVLPEWFYNLQIDNLTIEGKMSDEQEAAIKAHFPHATIRRYVNGSIRIASNMPETIINEAPSKSKLTDSLLAKKTKKKKEVKNYNTLFGTVRDGAGPLIGATICEIDEQGRIIKSTVSDINGRFNLLVNSPQHKFRINHIGFDTVTLDYSKKKLDIVMQPKNSWRVIPLNS